MVRSYGCQNSKGTKDQIKRYEGITKEGRNTGTDEQYRDQTIKYMKGNTYIIHKENGSYEQYWSQIARESMESTGVSLAEILMNTPEFTWKGKC